LNHHWSVERIQNGWDLHPPDEAWIIGPPKNKAETPELFEKIMKYVENADVVIAGLSPLAPKDFYERRVKKGKLTFFMGERFFKKAVTFKRLLNPRFWSMIREVRKELNYPNIHYLTMNHYCADDLKFMRLCKNRIWTWGYLISVPDTPPPARENCKMQIMWCGRMLNWKRVDLLVRAIGLMKKHGCDEIEVEIIGDGEEKNKLTSLIKELNLDDIITIQSFLPKDIIREKMRKADVYVFTSNREEGWGAALPEAMSEGCVAVANREAGSTLELIRNKENGFVFEDGNFEELAKYLQLCYEKPEMRKDIGLKAWETMREWRPLSGAERFIQLAESIITGENKGFDTGLCAPRG
jgi:glycosyltransferase involved in cell wall biosynthesis